VQNDVTIHIKKYIRCSLLHCCVHFPTVSTILLIWRSNRQELDKNMSSHSVDITNIDLSMPSIDLLLRTDWDSDLKKGTKSMQRCRQRGKGTLPEPLPEAFKRFLNRKLRDHCPLPPNDDKKLYNRAMHRRRKVKKELEKNWQVGIGRMNTDVAKLLSSEHRQRHQEDIRTQIAVDEWRTSSQLRMPSMSSSSSASSDGSVASVGYATALEEEESTDSNSIPHPMSPFKKKLEKQSFIDLDSQDGVDFFLTEKRAKLPPRSYTPSPDLLNETYVQADKELGFALPRLNRTLPPPKSDRCYTPSPAVLEESYIQVEKELGFALPRPNQKFSFSEIDDSCNDSDNRKGVRLGPGPPPPLPSDNFGLDGDDGFEVNLAQLKGRGIALWGEGWPEDTGDAN